MSVDGIKSVFSLSIFPVDLLHPFLGTANYYACRGSKCRQKGGNSSFNSLVYFPRNKSFPVVKFNIGPNLALFPFRHVASLLKLKEGRDSCTQTFNFNVNFIIFTSIFMSL